MVESVQELEDDDHQRRLPAPVRAPRARHREVTGRPLHARRERVDDRLRVARPARLRRHRRVLVLAAELDALADDDLVVACEKLPTQWGEAVAGVAGCDVDAVELGVRLDERAVRCSERVGVRRGRVVGQVVHVQVHLRVERVLVRGRREAVHVGRNVGRQVVVRRRRNQTVAVGPPVADRRGCGCGSCAGAVPWVAMEAGGLMEAATVDVSLVTIYDSAST